MRAANVGLGAFSCLFAVGLAVAMQAGDAADDLLESRASGLLSAQPSRSPQSWATRYAAAVPQPVVLALSDLAQAENVMLDPTLKLSSRSRVNQRHLLTIDSRRSSEDTSLRAIATKDTPATDQAMAATPTTCDKCQWQ